MNDYQISNDGTIFHIKEDGSISRLGKIENERIIGINNSPAPSNARSEKGALVFFMVVFAIATLIFGVMFAQYKYNYDNASSKIISLERKISSLENDLGIARSERDLAKQELSDFKDNVGRTIPLVISDIMIGNMNNNGVIETNFGSKIYSSQTMYLTPKISYVGFTSGNKKFYIKLYYPDGTMSTGTTSPSGYSYSDSAYISTGQHSFQLMGWGNSTKGNWRAGNYRIEIWYNNTCLKSKSFTIY